MTGGGPRMIAGDHDRADAGAPARARPRRCASARGGSIMPIRPSEDEILLDVARRRSSSARARVVRQRSGRRRRACAAPRRRAPRWRRRISARRFGVSGRRSSPTSSCVQRASSTSGAPLVKTSSALLALGVACGPCSSACARRRTAPRRRARSARRARRPRSPALRAATISAPSVGSPCTVQRPSRSLQRRRCWRGRRRRARAPARSAARRRLRRRRPARTSPSGAYPVPPNVDAPARGDDRAHRHLVLRQRAGLVGGDDGRRAERLDRGAGGARSRCAAPCAARRCESTAVTTAGSPSGTAATASATPRMSTSKIAGQAAHVLDEDDRRDHHDGDDDDDRRRAACRRDRAPSAAAWSRRAPPSAARRCGPSRSASRSP